MYKVICRFADLLDMRHVYEVGDEYPRKGYSPSSDRFEELSTNRNKLHRPLIELVPGTVTEEPEEVTEKTTTRGRRKAKDGNAN